MKANPNARPGQYRSKPVVIEAADWYEMPRLEFQAWCPVAEYKLDDSGCPYVLIKTPEGTMRGDIGDMIVKGLKGEFYPVKPDVFAIKYERIPPQRA